MTVYTNKYKVCPQCQGTGDAGIEKFVNGIPISFEVCPTCNGEKFVLDGKLEITTIITPLSALYTISTQVSNNTSLIEDIKTKVNHIKNKVKDIEDKVDSLDAQIKVCDTMLDDIMVKLDV